MPSHVAPTSTTQHDDVRAVLVEMLAAGRDDDLVELVVGLLAQVRDENSRLALQLAQLRKQLFGRRSEKIDPAQLRLLLAELGSQEAPPAPEPPPPARAASRPRPKPTGRKPLPASLPRETIPLMPSPEERRCATCERDKTKIGTEKSEVLEFVPASFKVLVYVREKFACPRCQDGVVIGPLADKPVEGGRPGPGLLAHVLVSKFKDHVPLHRLAGIYARAGVEIADSTLGDWVRVGAELFAPVSLAILSRVLASHVVQVDDTGLRVLDQSHAGGSKKGHLWGLVGDRRLVAFAYTEDWSGEKARALLRDRVGWLQADAYAGFDKLFAARDAKVVEVGCLAHARRKFVEAFDAGDLRAGVAVQTIARLYAVEDEADAAGLDAAARWALRQERSAPVVNELGAWIAKVFPSATPKSPLGRALGYALNQWKALVRFLEDGALELDNNGVERALRTIAVGRANWIFAGSDAGARRAAILYTIFGTCALCGVEPWAYARDIVEKISGDFPQSRIGELVPDVWAARRAAAAAAAA